MVEEHAQLKGFRGIEAEIPDIAFQKVPEPSRYILPKPREITGQTLLLGLPLRSQTVDQAFEWADYDLEYVLEPEQEKNRKESLDYIAALFVFQKNGPKEPPSGKPVLIAAVYEDPETEVPQGVVFSADGAVAEEFSKDFSNPEELRAHLLRMAGNNLGLFGEPEELSACITQHPIEERQSAALKEAVSQEAKTQDKNKGKGVLSFWIALALGVLVFIAAFYYSGYFFS